MKNNTSKLFLLFILSLCFVVSTTCKKLEKKMLVSTGEVTNILIHSADVSGLVVDIGDGATQRGHCYGTSSNVNIDGLKTQLGAPSGPGGFTSQLTNLDAGTKYYVKAYITDGAETVYGKETNFTTTSPTVATLTTTAITSITSTTAASGGDITSDGGSSVTARGVCWKTSTGPTINNNKTTDASGTGSYSSSITGLTANTTYYVRAYATNSVGTAYGDELSFTTAALVPTLTTKAITEITQTTATSGGNITDDGGAAVTARGVCWSTGANPTTSDSKTTNGTGSGSFSSSITGLTANTTYYVRAYATNSVGTAYGNELTFNTSAVLPGISTLAVTLITTTSASSGGNISSDGGSAITVRGVCWNTSANPTTANSKTTDGSGTSSFISSLTGLTPGTTYFVRAYATNSVGTAYGNEVTFTTSAVLPTLTTAAITSITTTTATSGGNISSDGGAVITARGVCWNTSASPATSNNKTTDGSGTGSFVSNLSGLTAGTLYYVRAYATNSVGTAYGDELFFTATAITQVIPALSTTAVSAITSSTATSGGNITSQGGAVVTARGVCWSTVTNPTISNSITSDGSGIGSFVSNLSGLAAGTTYYVRAYATNSFGTAYGLQVSFTTANSSVTIISSFTVPGSSPTAIEWDGSSLWMIDNLNNFYHLDTLGNVLGSFAFHTAVADMAWDGDALWVSTSSQMEKIDANGNVLSTLPISYWYGDGLAWDGIYFWVSNYNIGTVYKHDHSGNPILYFETSFFGHPTSMTFNGTDLLIGDSFELYNRIYLYSRTGVEKSYSSIDDIGLTKIKTFEKKVMAWDGKYLWYSSDARFEIFKLKIE